MRLRAAWMMLVCLGAAHLLAPRLFGLDEHKQISQYVQTTLTDKTGLPQNSVNAIAQSADGYLWFGTEEGLARFDGMQMTVFDTRRNHEMRDNLIRAVAASRDGGLWVGTRSEVMELRDGVFHTVISAQSQINTIFAAQDGRVWVGSTKGLYSIDHGSAHLFTAREGMPEISVKAVAQTADGTLWLGTEKGLFGERDGRFRLYTPAEGAPAGAVLSLTAAADGSLWMGSIEGLTHWKGKVLERWLPSALPLRSRLRSLLVDRNGNLWMSFDHDGIATLRDGKVVRYTAKEGLPNDDTSQLFEDRGGHLWVGLGEGGVVELRDGVFSSFGTPEGLAQDMLWSVLVSRDGTVWAGTDTKGLDHIERTGAVRHYTVRDGLAEGSVDALWEDRDGSLWVGSERGVLGHLKDGRITNYHDPGSAENRLQAIVQDPSGDLWLGFHEANGLVRFHAGSFTHYAVPGLPTTLTLAPDGSLWVGGDHGGISHFAKGVLERTYTTKDGLLSNFAGAIYVDREGVVWTGTSPGGLNRIKDGRITTYSVDQGLADPTVGSIIEDDLGNLWMSCNKGIYKVSKKELNDFAEGRAASIHSVMYGTVDGMRSAECNFGSNPAVWKGSDGHLWFITVAGLLSVDPVHSETENSQPLARAEEVRFNRHEVSLQSGVSVGPGTGDVEIRFTAPDFTAPERLRFRYKLDPFDQDWVEVGNRRTAFYTKVPPGRYRFLLQSADRNGDWGTATTKFDLQIRPHLWQTWWFFSLCGVVVLVICVVLYRLRVQYFLSLNHELEAKVCERTKELQEALEVAALARDALHEQATRDALTKLWNRRTILEILDTETGRALREGQPLCVLMVDVDHFKRVNDTCGHVVGDRVLEEVSARVMSLIRSYDSAGRYGGEEFLIVLPGCSLADGERRAEEFRSVIAGTRTCVGDMSLEVTCSFGIASGIQVSASRLILDADQALYRAKQAGRNRVHSAGHEVSEGSLVLR